MMTQPTIKVADVPAPPGLGNERSLAYKQYVGLLYRLDVLLAQGVDDEQADDLRDQMEPLWAAMEQSGELELAKLVASTFSFAFAKFDDPVIFSDEAWQVYAAVRAGKLDPLAGLYELRRVSKQLPRAFSLLARAKCFFDLGDKTTFGLIMERLSEIYQREWFYTFTARLAWLMQADATSSNEWTSTVVANGGRNHPLPIVMLAAREYAIAMPEKSYKVLPRYYCSWMSARRLRKWFANGDQDCLEFLLQPCPGTLRRAKRLDVLDQIARNVAEAFPDHPRLLAVSAHMLRCAHPGVLPESAVSCLRQAHRLAPT